MHQNNLAFIHKANTFGESNIQYHDFDNQDVLTFTDKYTALLQQELQNPYWCLHDSVTNKSYCCILIQENKTWHKVLRTLY